MNEIRALDERYVANTYRRFPVEVVRGKGSYLFDAEGKRYIDMGSGIGVTAFGIGDEAWKKAVIDQLDKVQHTSNLYYTEPCAALAAALCERTGMKKVFFANSGAEANECAIKVARKWAQEKRGIENPVIVTLENSFHGRTLTTLAATGQACFHTLFAPLTPGFCHTPANDFSAMEKALSRPDTAAVMIECVQGEGGVLPLDADFVKKTAELAAKKEILLLVDEVQTGNGRTGALYAYMHYGIRPDVVTTAKGLGGGLPIGAALLGEKTADTLGYGDHGSTFGGNPVVCAGAKVCVDRISDPAFLASVQEKGEYIRKVLADVPEIESITGMGMMLGLKLRTKVSGEVAAACLKQGLMVLTAKEKVRLLPPLNISKEELDAGLAILKQVLSE